MSVVMQKPRPGLVLFFTLAVVVALGVTLVSAHGGDTSQIHSCVKTGDDDHGGSGRIRIVGEHDTCRRNETALDWNQAGPPGPVGPPGPPGVGLDFRVISSGKVFVAGNGSPILATFQRQPGERVVPMVWASEKSGVYIIGLQGTIAPPNDRTLSFFLEKTTNPNEMSLRCNNGDEDVEVEWVVLGLTP